MKPELARGDASRPRIEETGRRIGEGTALSDRALVVQRARAGEERLAHQFLVEAGYPVSASEHLAQRERPGYQICERLLLRSGARILAHLRCPRRPTRLAGESWDLLELTEWAVHPAIPIDLGGVLWETAQVEARGTKELGIVTSCPLPSSESEANWVRVRQPPWHELSPADFLAHLDQRRQNHRITPLTGSQANTPLGIRVWRHVEQAALRRLYRKHATGWGARERSEEYWRWLISRRSFDRIYVAVEGTGATGFDDPEEAIVGYAVVRGIWVIEWAAGRAPVFRRLLKRIAQDAMERDVVAIRVAPPWGPPQAVDRCRQLLAAAGRVISPPLTWHAKFFHPLRLIDRLRPVLAERALNAESFPVSELGFDVQGHRFQIVLDGDRTLLVRDRLGRSHLRLDLPTLLQLLLGSHSVDELVADGRISASTKLAEQGARVLFPPLEWQISPWDTAPALDS